MGSVSYDFLVNSILFRDTEIENHYSSLSDNQLEKVLLDYREHCLKNLDVLTGEIVENKSSLKVLSGIEKLPYETLKQSALYFDQFVIYDPLFSIARPKHQATTNFSEFLGYKDSGINRQELVQTVMLLKAITPMIAADYVKMLPLSNAFEPPKEIPLKLPINYYADVLPPELMNYCRERAVVNSMTKTEHGWHILDKHDLTPGLFIGFDGLNTDQGSIYNYHQAEYENSNGSNEVTFTMKLADYPLDKEVWDLWVFQSTNSAAKVVVDKIYYENVIANRLNATYLTRDPFTSGLLTKDLATRETVETASASQFMNVELPFLDRVDIDKLMLVRKYEEDTFTNFRIELERQFRELRLVKDPVEIKLREENIMHELGVVQVGKINQKLDSLKRRGLVDGLLLVGGLAGTVQTAGWSLIASALASVNGYKSYQEYSEELRVNPSYLLWKVLKN